MPAAKAGWFVPSKDRAWDFERPKNWDPDWTGMQFESSLKHGRDLSILSAWLPYMLVALLLVATRLEALPLADLIKSVTIPVEGILGTEISRTVVPLYLPGTVFIVVSLMTFLLHRMNPVAYGRAWTKSGEDDDTRLGRPGVHRADGSGVHQQQRWCRRV